MLKSVMLISSLAIAIFSSTSIAMADDASDIQALITADMTARDCQQPGVFYQLNVTISFPYAHVQALIATSGYGGMSYALSKSSGAWKILGSGGGEMVPSVLVDYGMPVPTAEALQGFACHSEPRNFSTSAAVKHLVAKRGPSVLPKRKVVTRYKGRVDVVTIFKPLSGRICTLFEPRAQ